MIKFGQRLALLGVLAGICSGTAEAKNPIIRVEFSRTANHQCKILIRGVDYQPNELSAAAEAFRKNEPDAHVHLGGTPETPWECFGGALTAFQRAGFKNIGFVGQPDPGKR